MIDESTYMNRLLGFLVELLDIPPSYYQQAADRYESLGRWLHRPESKVAALSPEVYPQGSFRYGTVIRPLNKAEEYDLDLVCQILLSKADVTQRYVKHLVGDEIKAYAEANSFNEPAEEKPRCWRLNYADDVSFHMDILPCIPESREFIQALREALLRSGESPDLANTAVAITDKRDARYTEVTTLWPSSNPRGIATWFENRMRPAASTRIKSLVENRAYATVDDVPPYEWKTPLQRSIQILKRHRDVMFADPQSAEWKPLSMIILTLATHSYGGETDLYEALTNIVNGMLCHIRSTAPRVPNPVNPAEDFADRWASDSRYEQNLRAWHAQVKADLKHLRGMIGNVSEISRGVRSSFNLGLTTDMEKRLDGSSIVSAPHIITATPAVRVSSPPKPWRKDD